MPITFIIPSDDTDQDNALTLEVKGKKKRRDKENKLQTAAVSDGTTQSSADGITTYQSKAWKKWNAWFLKEQSK